VHDDDERMLVARLGLGAPHHQVGIDRKLSHASILPSPPRLQRNVLRRDCSAMSKMQESSGPDAVVCGGGRVDTPGISCIFDTGCEGAWGGGGAGRRRGGG